MRRFRPSVWDMPVSIPLRPRALGHGLRRRLLIRRRPLALLLTAVAVVAGLQVTRPPTPPTDPVLVAARDLRPGATLRADDLIEVAFARGTAPTGLVASPVGRILTTPLRRGEPVTAPRLLGPVRAADHPGRQAMPVRIPDRAMVDLLRVGDLVDVIAADPRGAEARVLARGVPVLAVPHEGAERGAQPLPGGLFVGAFTPEEITAVSAANVAMLLTIAFSR